MEQLLAVTAIGADRTGLVKDLRDNKEIFDAEEWQRMVVGLDLVVAAATSAMVLVGIGLYLLATVSWLAVLSRIDLAVA